MTFQEARKALIAKYDCGHYVDCNQAWRDFYDVFFAFGGQRVSDRASYLAWAGGMANARLGIASPRDEVGLDIFAERLLRAVGFSGE